MVVVAYVVPFDCLALQFQLPALRPRPSFASGMAGVAAVFDQLRVGSQVVRPDDCYQGVVGLAELGRQMGLWSLRRLAVDDTARRQTTPRPPTRRSEQRSSRAWATASSSSRAPVPPLTAEPRT
jgi:hypothetical protein